MTQPLLSTPADLADRSQEVVAAHGLSTGALGAMLFALLDQMQAPFAIKEIGSGRYVNVNAAMAALAGRPTQELLAQTDAELFGGDVAAALRSADAMAAASPVPHTSEHHVERDRQRRDFRVTRMALPTADGSAPRHLCCAWVESTAEQQRAVQLLQALRQLEQQQVAMENLRRELQDQSLRDQVTGLYQRAHFDDQLRREVDLSSREHREFALVAIALDALPPATANFGAAGHQRVLEALGRLLRGNTRAMDASCRLDQDRFAILLSGVGLATAHSRMEGLRRQCATQIVAFEGHNLGFSVSMGVASFPHTAHSQDELLRAAHDALAEAMKRGGNHVALASIRFESPMQGA